MTLSELSRRANRCSRTICLRIFASTTARANGSARSGSSATDSCARSRAIRLLGSRGPGLSEIGAAAGQEHQVDLGGQRPGTQPGADPDRAEAHDALDRAAGDVEQFGVLRATRTISRPASSRACAPCIPRYSTSAGRLGDPVISRGPAGTAGRSPRRGSRSLPRTTSRALLSAPNGMPSSPGCLAHDTHRLPCLVAAGCQRHESSEYLHQRESRAGHPVSNPASTRFAHNGDSGEPCGRPFTTAAAPGAAARRSSSASINASNPGSSISTPQHAPQPGDRDRAEAVVEVCPCYPAQSLVAQPAIAWTASATPRPGR